MKKLKDISIVISILLNLLLFGCQDNDNILGTDNLNNETPGLASAKYFYSGQWEFKGVDIQDNYEFQLNVEFKTNENNEFSKAIGNKDSVEINSASIKLSPFIFNGDSSGDSIIIRSNTYYIDHTVILDSLISIKNGLQKSYVVKIPKSKLKDYSNITDDGILNLVLSLYISGGYITNETDYEIIRRKMLNATASSAYFMPLNNELIRSNFGLN